ncbi:hypothetical protein FOZ61_002164 [Perkinsus olseni]|uniref:Uncharacterized protein n=1 Tax=Perkinsus olseni TaxID=32597 RepID=A0A7J6LU61_PEROL|nr:hypothetical protein FOZ61_002164 [Perkinsus olseni]
MASESDMAFTSSNELKPADDPLGEANFVPRYLVCVNPLCRRKWKQLTPKSIPMFCPSCKKAFELALRETWEGVTDDTLYYNVLKYWHGIYVDIQSTLGYPKCKDLNLPADPKEVTILNVMDYYHQAFPEAPQPEDVRNWSSMGQRKKQMTGTIIRQCGGLLWELTVLEDLQHPHGQRSTGSQRHHDMVGHRFYLIDWRGALKIGDHLQFVAFPNPSVDERGKLPHVLKVLDDRVNPPHRQPERSQDTSNVTHGQSAEREQERMSASTVNGTSRGYSRGADSYYRGPIPSYRDQRQPIDSAWGQHTQQRRPAAAAASHPQYDINAKDSMQRSFGVDSGSIWRNDKVPSRASQYHTTPSGGSGGVPAIAQQDATASSSPDDGRRATAAAPSSSSSSKSPDEKKKAFSPEVGSLVDSAVAPPPGFEDLPDDTHLCLGQLAQLLTAAANKEVPPTPQAPTLEPKIPENLHPSPSPAVPAARRPDWIPDTPASPLYLHRDMNFGQTPNPLVQFLQMQAAAGAAGQIPTTVAASRGSYGTAAPPPMATPFMPMGGPPPQAAAAVGLDGDLAGLAAWGASWPSSVPSGMSKRQSTSQPPTPIQEETVDEKGEVCAPPSSQQQQQRQ